MSNDNLPRQPIIERQPLGPLTEEDKELLERWRNDLYASYEMFNIGGMPMDTVCYMQDMVVDWYTVWVGFVVGAKRPDLINYEFYEVHAKPV